MDLSATSSSSSANASSLARGAQLTMDRLEHTLAQVCLCLFVCLLAMLGLTNERFGAALRAATGATQAAARPAAHPAGARGLFVCLLLLSIHFHSHTHTHTLTHVKLHICDLLV